MPVAFRNIKRARCKDRRLTRRAGTNRATSLGDQRNPQRKVSGRGIMILIRPRVRDLSTDAAAIVVSRHCCEIRHCISLRMCDVILHSSRNRMPRGSRCNRSSNFHSRPTETLQERARSLAWQDRDDRATRFQVQATYLCTKRKGRAGKSTIFGVWQH